MLKNQLQRNCCRLDNVVQIKEQDGYGDERSFADLGESPPD